MMQGRMTGNPGYTLKLLPKDKKVIDTFLEKADSQGIDVSDYLMFQFSYRQYFGKTTKSYTIRPKDVVGAKAFKLWQERKKKQEYMSSESTKFFKPDDLGIDKVLTIDSQYLDGQRQKDFSTARGFLRCQSYGGLYDSLKCQGCSYANICESMTKDYV